MLFHGPFRYCSSCVSLKTCIYKIKSDLAILKLLPGYIDGLGDAVEQGLVKAVGVSNYSGTSLENLDKLCN